MNAIRTIPFRRAAIAVVLALMLVACDQKGPDPTDAILTAPSGPFTVSTVAVPSSAGFGGGTIYYPNNVDGPFAAISVTPGFFGTQSSIAAWALAWPRTASWSSRSTRPACSPTRTNAPQSSGRR
jgi:hypothetical protein